MYPFPGDIHDALVAHMAAHIHQANGYRTDAGQDVSAGFVADATGAYFNNEIIGDSLVVQPDELNRSRQEGSLSLTVYGLTKSAAVTRLHQLEDDIYRALRDADFHPGIKGVEFQTVKFGAGESKEFFGAAVPLRILFTHSPF